MSPSVIQPGSRSAAVWQAVALFFLLFTAYDLLSPEACAEELLGLPSAVVASNAHEEHDVAPTLPAGCAEDELPVPCGSVPDEDCFCCCAHLLVQQVFVAPGADTPHTTHAARPLQLPTAPPERPFHPPRTLTRA